jgi:hypothetical protein
MPEPRLRLINPFARLRTFLAAPLLLLLLAPIALHPAQAALGHPANPDALYGIGAVVGSDGAYPTIREIVPGGAAERDARLKVNDRIAGVAQGDAPFVDCTGMSVDKATGMIRGKNGTTVRLQIIPAGATDPAKREVIALVRTELKVKKTDVSDIEAQTEISPERQAKLDEAVKKIAASTQKLLAANIEAILANVVQATSLDAAGKSSLEAASAKAVDQCLQKRVVTLHDDLRAQFKEVPAAQLGLVLSQVDANADMFAKAMQMQSGNWPADQPAWKDALKQTLTPSQAAAWDAAEAKRKQALDQQIGDFLKGVAHFASDQQKPGLKEKVSRIQSVLDLPKDRLDKLNAAADSMLDQFGSDTSARAEKALLAMGDDQRKETLAQRQQSFYNWIQPAPETAWDQGLSRLLTPEETHRLQTAGDDRKTRRANSMGKLLLALLDEKIALTAAQRTQLEPILQTLVKQVPDLIQDEDLNNYFYYSPSLFYGAISNAPADQVKAILDPIQMRHWQEVAKLKDIPDPNMYVSNAIQLPAVGDAAKPAPPAEPEDVERAISDFLEQKSSAEREKILSGYVLKAEDIARVVHLPPAPAERLQTAARGTAEALVAQFDQLAESMVRSTIGNVSPDTVKGRLDSIQSFQFQQLEFNSQQLNRANSQSIWDTTVKAVLTPDQEKAWEQETTARSAYRQQAVAAMVVAAFDQRTNLSPAQWAKLEPLVTKIMTDYGDEFGRFFAYSQPWFLQSFSIFLPIAGVPEKDMKSILTTEQWDNWTGSNQFSNANQYWTMIDQNHRQRTKVR